MRIFSGVRSDASMAPLDPCRSPEVGNGCPLAEMRASTVTCARLDRLRPGSIDWLSSNVNLSGQLPTVVRITATGGPGASTDLATMKRVAPAAALARSAGAIETSPLTLAAPPLAAPAAAPGAALFAALVDAALTIDQLPETLTGTWQVVDLARGVPTRTFPTRLPGSDDEQHVHFSEYGLTRLRNGLKRAGLDPKFFEWPPAGQPNRPPYLGFAPLDAPDAGVFFGREAPLIEAIDKLRGLALGEPPRVHVLLGASGAGKSSFLRAGLLPRLQRNDRHFLPLPPLRPERAPILGDGGLLGSLVKAFSKETRAALRTKVRSEATLRPLLRSYVAEAQARITLGESAARPPVLVIAIDQAEELFTAENAVQGMQLLETLSELARVDDPATIVVFGIRSDAYDRVQQAKPRFELPQQTQSLPPLPRGEYARVIEGPAGRVADAGGKLKIDPRLTEALLQDLSRIMQRIEPQATQSAVFA